MNIYMKSQIEEAPTKETPVPTMGSLWEKTDGFGRVVFLITTAEFNAHRVSGVVVHTHENSYEVGAMVIDVLTSTLKPFTGSLKLWNDDRSLF